MTKKWKNEKKIFKENPKLHKIKKYEITHYLFICKDYLINNKISTQSIAELLKSVFGSASTIFGPNVIRNNLLKFYQNAQTLFF